MRIAVAVYGIPRGAEVTYSSLYECIIRPAMKVGEVKLFGHFYRLDKVVNPRSHENHPLPAVNYEIFKEFQMLIEPPDLFLDDWGLGGICDFGDFYLDEFQSLRNLYHQLHSLESVTNSMIEYSPHVVIFARPDLYYHNNISTQALYSAFENSKKCLIPEWQWWGGYNDRFSVCGQDAYIAYGMRIREALHYCQTQKAPLHAERLLHFAIKNAKLTVRLVDLFASRVRTNNVMMQENFNARETLGSDSTRLVAALRYRQIFKKISYK